MASEQPLVRISESLSVIAGFGLWTFIRSLLAHQRYMNL